MRVCKALESTETFKQKKQQLLREGFDPAQVTDPLFLKNPADGRYQPIDRTVYTRIVKGLIRL